MNIKKRRFRRGGKARRAGRVRRAAAAAAATTNRRAGRGGVQGETFGDVVREGVRAGRRAVGNLFGRNR